MKQKEITIRSSAAEYLTLVVSTGDSLNSVEMRYKYEYTQLTQIMMATLYNMDVQTVNHHVRNVFENSELTEEPVLRKFRITAADEKQYNTMHYNLQMIVAVGFKFNNERAVQFCKRANTIVKDYTIKNWVIDDDRLKNGRTVLPEKYFEEQLEKLREIRLSEQQFYQKIIDIYATVLNSDKSGKTTKEFFAKVQNKLHFAVRSHTVAEVIYERADADKLHMGLAFWKAALGGKIMKSDVSMAKNNLIEDELHALKRIVSPIWTWQKTALF